jgi:hypothetical protein
VRAPVLRRPVGLGAAVATIVCAVALGVALGHLPGAVRGLDNRAAHNAKQRPVDRDLEIARFIGISTGFVQAAQRLLPHDATYVVDTGPAARPPSPLVLSALPGYLQNLLLPRIAAEAEPQWLLCYGCDRARWKIKRIAWRDGSLEIARLRG